ncbi:hypothetical protein IC582_012626 [Cucumis melo]
MSDDCKGKSSWPELVLVSGNIAEKIIEKENHYVNAIIVEQGKFVTQDFRCDRVWVWVDKYTRIVVKTPIIG